MKTRNIKDVRNDDPDANQNKDLVRRAVEEIWNKGNYDSLRQFVSEDFVVHLSADEKIYGVDGIKQFFSDLRNAFPDIRFVIEDQVAEGDRVVTHWSAVGTHRGSFKGIPPSGNRLRFTAIDIDRIAEGKVVECWSKMDELGLLKQLGVITAGQ